MVLCVWNVFKQEDAGVFKCFKMIGNRLHVVISHSSEAIDNDCFPIEYAEFYHDYANKY